MRRSSGRPFGPLNLVVRLRTRRAAGRYADHGWPVRRHRPHAVLLPTGELFDALEVPATVGVRVLGTARLHAELDLPDLRGPVLSTPSGNWIFLVRPGEPLRSDLDDCPDVHRHGPGSWIPAAPSRTAAGVVRWVVPPERVGWRLPASAAVQGMLAADRRTSPVGTRTRVPRNVVPRQRRSSRRPA